jgi:hypothetical protein
MNLHPKDDKDILRCEACGAELKQGQGATESNQELDPVRELLLKYYE